MSVSDLFKVKRDLAQAQPMAIISFLVSPTVTTSNRYGIDIQLLVCYCFNTLGQKSKIPDSLCKA